ncbi:MAG: IclR family transcriptional regulator [Alphaproteobacteria bacterium]|nr:IclR family transcriptional regulator [Alphaproteobacteria bacterium]
MDKTRKTKARPDRSSPLFVRSVEKALSFVFAFDGNNRKLLLSQIAQIAQTDLSTAQRFTFSLEQLGILRKDPETRLYEIGPQLLNLGYRYLHGNELIERATPVMLQLSKTTETNISLMVREDIDTIYIGRFQSRNFINPEIMVGARLPLFATAGGLALLAQLNQDEVDEVFARSTFEKITSFTEIDPAKIRERLELVRERGYAVAHQETSIGDISVAAAIVDGDRSPIAALSISASAMTISIADAERQFAPLVMAAASSLSNRR